MSDTNEIFPFPDYLKGKCLVMGVGTAHWLLVGRLTNLLLLFHEHVVVGGEKDGAVR